MKPGPTCSGCGVNESLIINGIQYLCPACEMAAHTRAQVQTYHSNGPQPKTAPAPQYKD